MAQRRRRAFHVGRGALAALAFRRHRARVAVAGLCLLLGVSAAAVPWSRVARDARIARDGVATMATVTRHETIQNEGREPEHRIHYTFVLADGTPFQSQEIVDQHGFESAHVGDPIRVVYDPARPDDGYPLGNGAEVDGSLKSRWTAVLLSGLGALLVGGGVVLLWGPLVRLPRLWHRLLHHGYEVMGTVTRIEVDAPRSRARIHYAYADRAGGSHQNKTAWAPRELVDGWQDWDQGIVQCRLHDPSRSIWLGRGDLRFFR